MNTPLSSMVGAKNRKDAKESRPLRLCDSWRLCVKQTLNYAALRLGTHSRGHNHLQMQYLILFVNLIMNLVAIPRSILFMRP